MTILGGRAGRGTGIVHTKKGDLLGVHRRVRPSGVSECVDCESRVNARVGYIRYIYMEYAVRWGGGAKARATGIVERSAQLAMQPTAAVDPYVRCRLAHAAKAFASRRQLELLALAQTAQRESALGPVAA